MNKSVLVKNFSKHAHRYDTYADIQRLVARELIKEITRGDIFSILELGCGTGVYTDLLRERFPGARLTAVDISYAMIEVAREKFRSEEVTFVTADAEDVEIDDTFDLITSNAAFQWFDDLEDAVKRYRGALSERGEIAFSVFGYDTFRELKGSLKILLGERAAISTERFPCRIGIEKILGNHLEGVWVREMIIEKEYTSLMELLRGIKYTGTRGWGLKNGLTLRQGDIERLEGIYRRAFGNITATYQVFLCRGDR